MTLVNREENPDPAMIVFAERRRHVQPTRYLNEFPSGSRSGNDNRPAQEGHEAAPELDCLRGLIAPRLLQAAARRSHLLGIGAERVLIQRGILTEEAYVRHLAAHFRTGVNRLTGRDSRFALGADRLADAAASGIVPLWRDGRMTYVVAPQGRGARGLACLIAAHPELSARLELTTTCDLMRFLSRQRAGYLARQSAQGLHAAWPALSAAPPDRPRAGHHLARMMRIAVFAGLVALPPLLAEGIWTCVLTALFLGFVALRLLGSLTPRPAALRRARRPDHRLPVYTVIAALYREATSVAPLLRAIEALDYPIEKLDVILVVETNDPATRNAIARLGAMPHVRVLVAPAIEPTTKPKALNYALPFARGNLTAVFDAEDRPAAGQLRAALDIFHDGNDRVACAQAALCIDNAGESLIARMFAAEYAGQFDMFLPGLSALRLPLPLGGSSNHFRTDVLRKVGGWDAYNVTEDADLGIRLARFGYRSVTFASTTFEEAPIHLSAWLRQRTRWMKGWMQSWSVHMRSPYRLWRDAGPRGFVAINLMVGGSVLTALAYPTLIAGLALPLFGDMKAGWHGFLVNAWLPLHLTAIAAGYASTVVVNLLGLAHRRQLRHGWILLLTPIYWGLLSIAAWRALWQLLRAPHLWEKTEHGVSRRSQAMRNAQR